MHAHYNRDATERDRDDITGGPQLPPCLPPPPFGSSIESEQRGVISGVEIPIAGAPKPTSPVLPSLVVLFLIVLVVLGASPSPTQRVSNPKSCVMLITPTELHRGSIPTVSPDKISRILAAAAPPPPPRPSSCR